MRGEGRRGMHKGREGRHMVEGRREGYRGERGHREGGHRSETIDGMPQGAKTFRRKRAIQFLEHLETKRDTLKAQLETPELQAINTVVAGELKATQAIIDEFVQVFELFEFEEYVKLRTQQKEEN